MWSNPKQYAVAFCAKTRQLWFLLLAIAYSPFSWAALEFNLKPGVTSVSREVYQLHNTIFWVCVVIGLAVFGVMFYAIIRHRKSRGVKPADFHDSHLVEMIWTVVPFLILVGMAIPATKSLVHLYDTEDPDIDIMVTGYQWKWKYDYLNEDVSFFSELHSDSRNAIYGEAEKGEHYLLDVDNPVVVPINKKIRFLTTANDVIHSWWVPAIGVKRDAVPGFVNETWARIDEPGVYRGQCAELCGKDHGFMPIVVVAKAEDEYQAWLDAKKAEQAKETDLADKDFDWLMEKGKEVYLGKCSVCHQPGGQGLGMFPALKGSPVATTGPIEAHIQTILKGKNAMPAFGEQLDEIEVAAVTTYERNAWGNETGDVVQPSKVAEVKGQ